MRGDIGGGVEDRLGWWWSKLFAGSPVEEGAKWAWMRARGYQEGGGRGAER